MTSKRKTANLIDRNIFWAALAFIAWVILMLLFHSGEANAAHCGHGKIYRVSMGTCVGIGSRLALEVGYGHHFHRVRVAKVEEQPAPEPEHVTRRHRHRHHEHCDPVTQCGDPIEDRVEEQDAVPTATAQSDVEPLLPDPFGKSRMRTLQVNWWMGK